MLSFKLLAIVIATTVAGLGAVANALWGPRAQMKRRLERGATKIADREIVTLVGKVRALGAQLDAPLTGRPCVCFEAIARVYDGYGQHKTLSDTITDRQLVKFELMTDQGPVIVDSDFADLALPLVPLIPRKIDREAEFLETHGRSSEHVRTAGFDELVVQEGDKVAVQGMALVELATDVSERGYRDAPTRVRIVAHAGHPLTIGRPR